MLRNFSASASIPWLRLWCCLFCSVCLFSAYLYPTVASLLCFRCGPPSLVVPVCVWGLFLWRQSCVYFLSSCWVWGRLLLSLFWCGFCASSWGACSFPRRVLQPVTLSGFRTYLAPVSWPTPAVAVSGYTTWFSTLCQRSFPFRCLTLAGSATFLAPVCWSTLAVEPCCWVGGVFDASLGFLPCAVLFLRGLQFAQLPCSRFPWGFSAFLSPGACPSASLVT